MNYNEVVSLVYQARKIVFEKQKLQHVENKNPYDFVTEVDTGISDFLKKELAKRFSDVGFMTEEETEHTLYSKSFIVDPIDGTTNLIYGYRMSSISLAYAENGQVVFGVVLNPFSSELFFAIKDRGSYLFDASNGIDDLLKLGVENYTQNRLSVSKRPMEKALVEFGASSSHKAMTDETFARGGRVFKNCLDLRRTCSTAIAICYIAAGRLDGYFEKIIKPWDYAAGILILAEAGGQSSDWDKNPLPLDREGTIVCSNSVIHDSLIALL